MSDVVPAVAKEATEGEQDAAQQAVVSAPAAPLAMVDKKHPLEHSWCFW
jgi:hypothetical protein